MLSARIVTQHMKRITANINIALTAAHEWTEVKAMTEYGEGYILKESLIDLVEWDNDIEQWVISDNNFDYLMTKNENLGKGK